MSGYFDQLWMFIPLNETTVRCIYMTFISIIYTHMQCIFLSVSATYCERSAHTHTTPPSSLRLPPTTATSYITRRCGLSRPKCIANNYYYTLYQRLYIREQRLMRCILLQLTCCPLIIRVFVYAWVSVWVCVYLPQNDWPEQERT